MATRPAPKSSRFRPHRLRRVPHSSPPPPPPRPTYRHRPQPRTQPRAAVTSPCWDYLRCCCCSYQHATSHTRRARRPDSAFTLLTASRSPASRRRLNCVRSPAYHRIMTAPSSVRRAASSSRRSPSRARPLGSAKSLAHLYDQPRQFTGPALCDRPRHRGPTGTPLGLSPHFAENRQLAKPYRVLVLTSQPSPRPSASRLTDYTDSTVASPRGTASGHSTPFSTPMTSPRPTESE